jgi:hypothetical protein
VCENKMDEHSQSSRAELSRPQSRKLNVSKPNKKMDAQP